MAIATQKRTTIVTLAVLLLGVLVLIGYFLMDDDEVPRVRVTAPPETSTPSVPADTKGTAEAEAPELAPPAQSSDSVEDDAMFVLPLVDDSDALIRDGVLDMTRNEDINAWLGVDNLLRKTVTFVDNVAQGGVAKEPARVMAPIGKFQVTPIDDKTWYLNAESYRRYNLFGDIVESVDAQRAAELYMLVRSLFQNAYEDLGYGDASFDARLFQAIGRLLETPTIDRPIRLVRPGVFYEFEDPRLESLSAAQKQMLRMGPDNTRRLKAKLSDIALELRPLLDDR